MKKILPVLLLIIYAFAFTTKVQAKSVDEILGEYKKEYSNWKKEQDLKKTVDELVKKYPEKNKINQRIIARAFVTNFDVPTARVALEVAKNESGFRSEATNFNNNATWDKGCWQINDIHKVPDQDRLNCKRATEWTVKKVKRDGGFGAWVAYHKHVKNKNL